MSKQVIYPFQTPIYEYIIDDNDYKLIKDNVSFYLKNNLNKFKKKWDCPTLSSIDVSPNFYFKSKTLNKLLTNISFEYSKNWEYSLPSNSKLQYLISENWINVAPPGAYQEIHNHSNSLYSGVLYIDVGDNSGDLVLYNQNRLTSILMPPNKLNPSKFRIKPKNKKLIMFPSWLDHLVTENKSPQDRISISWNINFNLINK
jgi:uncharacterized protein (TIGR02466 family)